MRGTIEFLTLNQHRNLEVFDCEAKNTIYCSHNPFVFHKNITYKILGYFLGFLINFVKTNIRNILKYCATKALLYKSF